MINFGWFFLMFFSIFIAAATGRIAAISQTIFNSATGAIQFTLGIAGAIAFWTGILKVCERAGIFKLISRIFQPILVKLFPRLIDAPQLIALIAMTCSANLLGLGNVATPLGLKTMEALQHLNPDHERASDEICTFLTLILGGLCVLPTTLMAIRAQAGSENPELITGPILFVSVIGTLTGLGVNCLCLKLSKGFPRKEQR